MVAVGGRQWWHDEASMSLVGGGVVVDGNGCADGEGEKEADN